MLTLSVLLIFCSALVASPIMAQKLDKSTVTIKIAKGQSTGVILKKIEAATGLRFVYNPDMVAKNTRPVTGSFENEKVQDLLNQLGFRGTEKGAYVILSKMPVPVQKVLRVITGTVKDSTSMSGIPGVTVKVMGTNRGTTTDIDGKYSIGVEDNDMLSFSMIGFKTVTIKVTSRPVINVTLTEDKSVLNEVVVVGYGTQKKATLTGAITSVGLDKLSSRSLNSVGEVLAGKSPGVIVTNEGGDPTAAPRVNIRGAGGINGESPLYVVDGVLFTSAPQLNPNDIESMSVLKDAAAAIYGARASGGVVLITTKHGHGGKLQISFDAKVGAQSVWKKLDPLNAEERATVAATAARNGNSTLLPSFDATKYPDGLITRTNWMDEIFRTGMIQDYNTSINGGTDKSNFFLSFNYRKAEGIVENTEVKRYNFRINSDHVITPWLKIGENLSYSNTNGNGANTTSDYTGALLSAIYYPTNGTAYNADGSFAGLPGPTPGDYGDVINPVAELQRMDIQNPTHILTVNPYAELTLAKGLTFRSNLSITSTFNNYKSFIPKRPEVGKPVLDNSLEESNRRITDLLAEQVLSYRTQIGLHGLDFVGGYSFQKMTNKYLSVIGTGFDSEAPELRYMVNAKTIRMPIGTSMDKRVISSQFLRANYNYDEKYLLSLIGRRDATSMLSSDNRTNYYYSASGGWVISRENFLKESTWLNELKLRASYGLMGNLASLNPTDVSPLLSSTQAYFGQTPTAQNGYISTVLENTNLTWAESEQTNIGIDLGVLNRRLSLNADYFIKDTKNMIMNQSLPGTAGLSTQTINAGVVRDRGIELGITYNSNPDRAFTYSVNATLTKLNNKVMELAPGQQTLPVTNNFRNELAPLAIRVGQPLYSFYVLKTEGIFQSQQEADNYKNASGNKIQPNAKAGDFRFADLDGSGAIDGNDRYFAGSAYPDFSYGLSFNASYKNFDINIFAQGVAGNELFNAVKRTTYSASGPSYNKLSGILDAWSPENPGGKVPILSTSDANGNFNASDFYVENGSYLRLRNLTIGYTFPKSLSDKFKAGAIRVYATSNNLFTITDYSGFDPEIGMDNLGLDAGRYPQARTFMFGLSLSL
ncbi:SusC/RagA family TonB-linked outer membrane protein [Pedobacter sp. AW31-3R]|uniref:SusC/RagA family TonB-linked outer membrane protein n=1 Tax=Pedobacter sp. AW31-3R TaxID=3445781 RepID=UPI003FA03DA3